VYISSLMLMALYEDRVRDHRGRRAPQPGRARGPRIRSWATRARTTLRARSAFGAVGTDAEAAGVRP
jgi:hypothetical protein